MNTGKLKVEFPCGSVGKESPAVQEMQETQIRSLGRGEPLEDGMATHSSILAWRIPMDKKSLVGYSPQGHKESDTTEATDHTHTI